MFKALDGVRDMVRSKRDYFGSRFVVGKGADVCCSFFVFICGLFCKFWFAEDSVQKFSWFPVEAVLVQVQDYSPARYWLILVKTADKSSRGLLLFKMTMLKNIYTIVIVKKVFNWLVF